LLLSDYLVQLAQQQLNYYRVGGISFAQMLASLNYMLSDYNSNYFLNAIISHYGISHSTFIEMSSGVLNPSDVFKSKIVNFIQECLHEEAISYTVKS